MNQPMWDPYNRNCPSRQVLDRIGDRWSVLVVGALSQGPLRFSALAKRVDGVSQKMLTQTLRGLERDGLIIRTMYAQIPPRVEYQLSESGTSLAQPILALETWAKDNMPIIMSARETYDAKQSPQK
ncbi:MULTISPECIES: helix-turn-helix domain-containing protein [unclassified Arthrobacter]|uniref:winged helix-turn-helix transcriptional regulator n=1 Tax=unclassified Arthrobacter TaxID=235627 RepID=UPI000CE3B501|nr:MULTISPECIES: helix-turn-helix domain-containing protein [unclassified Arthrobacter]